MSTCLVLIIFQLKIEYQICIQAPRDKMTPLTIVFSIVGGSFYLAVPVPSVNDSVALARDIVLWKLFTQTFYCQPEWGGGGFGHDNHNTGRWEHGL